MEKESLEILKERLHIFVDDPKIPITDKVEVMINFMHILDKYKENMEVLEEHRILKLKEKENDI